jgi:two-component system NarL family response regulator
MLTVSEEDEDLFEAIKSGASGYLLKSLDAREFFDLLSGLERGETPLAPGLAGKILGEFAHQAERVEAARPIEEERREGLTPRQVEVLTLVARGLTYQEVGEVLCLSERTVKYHMGEILNRLHLENRAQMIAYAARRGLAKNET